MLSICFLLSFLLFVIPTTIKKIVRSILTMLTVEGTKQEMVSMELFLPQDLISNILSRLPAKDLLNCKCVCKSWFDLLTHRNFVSNYYVVHNDLQCQEKHLLVIRRPFPSNLDVNTYISVISWNDNDPKNTVYSHVLNPPHEYNSEHKYWNEILGPCHGIYFLAGDPNVMINPSLRQFKALPNVHFSSSHETYTLSNYAGFGFDSKSNDYKVIMMRDLWLKETDERKGGYWSAELYSLNSNSWRKINSSSLPLPFEILDHSRVYPYANNCYHWLAYVDDSSTSTKQDIVLAFDMINESFRKIKVPGIRSSKEEFVTLVPFNESATIGVIVYPFRGEEKTFDVWVMKDYWDEGSWVKQYSVEPIEAIHKLVGLYGNNQFLWSSRSEGLVWYDNEAESEKIKDLQICGKNGSLRGARYMESLVSLKRGNEFSCQLVSCSLVPDPLL